MRPKAKRSGHSDVHAQVEAIDLSNLKEGSSCMNKLSNMLLASTALVAAGPALAASSGNFTATVDDLNCTINSANGSFNGTGESSMSAGHTFEIGTDHMTINISNGNGTALVITPSLVTGLFTDNQITSKSATSTQDVGIQVQVNVTGPGPISIAPMTTGDAGNNTDNGATCTPPAGGVASCVIYDQRFVQVSSSVFQNISGCSTTFVTSVSGTTTVTLSSILATCFQMIQSTLSAHAFNFYVQAPGGAYNVDVDAQLFVGNGNTNNGSIAACAGPGTVTVQQVKNFSFDTPLSF